MCDEPKNDNVNDSEKQEEAKTTIHASCCGHDFHLNFARNIAGSVLKDFNMPDFKKNLPAMGREIREFVRSTLTTGRGNPIMVRIEDDVLESIDNMVASELFKSRSEAAAFLISKGLEATNDLFGKVMEKTNEIEKLREDIKDILGVKKEEVEPEVEPEKPVEEAKEEPVEDAEK